MSTERVVYRYEVSEGNRPLFSGSTTRQRVTFPRGFNRAHAYNIVINGRYVGQLRWWLVRLRDSFRRP